ncbi:zinc finger protein 891-like [Periplaneta americana]|uniref:zinc finger protein 891-like n=1 Tax=Periplaneta americana TaxID=6978 RepID=UPI0037E89AE5
MKGQGRPAGSTYLSRGERSSNQNGVVMDVIKMEPDVDPLAIQSSNDTESEERKPLLLYVTQEGNLLTSHVAWIKEECVDPSCEPTLNIKHEETPVPITVPVVKCEAEEDLCGTVAVKQELKLEVTAEDDEVLPHSIAVASDNGVPVERTSQRHSSSLEERKSSQSPEHRPSGKLARECQMHKTFSKPKNNLKTNSCSQTGTKSLKCSVCGRTLSNSYTLRQHLVTHTRERPFKCEFCGKCYTQMGNLRRHERNHTDKKLHRCNVCDKYLSTSQTLKLHVLSHLSEKLFKCPMCDKSMASPKSFRIHVRLHTGQNTHNCDICGKRFADSGNLEIHRRKHTGEKPLKCDVCGKLFRYRNSLRYHLQTHGAEAVSGHDLKNETSLKCYMDRNSVHKPSD